MERSWQNQRSSCKGYNERYGVMNLEIVPFCSRLPTVRQLRAKRSVQVAWLVHAMTTKQSGNTTCHIWLVWSRNISVNHSHTYSFAVVFCRFWLWPERLTNKNSFIMPAPSLQYIERVLKYLFLTSQTKTGIYSWKEYEICRK